MRIWLCSCFLDVHW